VSARTAAVSDVIQPQPADREALEVLAGILSRVPPNTVFCLAGPDEAATEVPESLYRALKDAVKILLDGSAVAISPLHRRLSTTEAGEILGVSRQFLTRLIDQGAIPCERTGRHRRLTLNDVLEYKDQRNGRRRAALAELTADAADMGAYD
jgi:excisionase family DNA binding protein